jgi:hypothetical protein
LAHGAVYTQQQHTTAVNTVNNGPIQPIYNVSVTEHHHDANYNYGYDSNFQQRLFNRRLPQRLSGKLHAD